MFDAYWDDFTQDLIEKKAESLRREEVKEIKEFLKFKPNSISKVSKIRYNLSQKQFARKILIQILQQLKHDVNAK